MFFWRGQFFWCKGKVFSVSMRFTKLHSSHLSLYLKVPAPFNCFQKMFVVVPYKLSDSRPRASDQILWIVYELPVLGCSKMVFIATSTCLSWKLKLYIALSNSGSSEHLDKTIWSVESKGQVLIAPCPHFSPSVEREQRAHANGFDIGTQLIWKHSLHLWHSIMSFFLFGSIHLAQQDINFLPFSVIWPMFLFFFSLAGIFCEVSSIKIPRKRKLLKWSVNF